MFMFLCLNKFLIVLDMIWFWEYLLIIIILFIFLICFCVMILCIRCIRFVMEGLKILVIIFWLINILFFLKFILFKVFICLWKFFFLYLLKILNKMGGMFNFILFFWLKLRFFFFSLIFVFKLYKVVLCLFLFLNVDMVLVLKIFLKYLKNCRLIEFFFCLFLDVLCSFFNVLLGRIFFIFMLIVLFVL